MATLDTPLIDVVGDRTARVLASGLDLVTVRDLLRHYPRRYSVRGELTDLRALQVGDEVTVQARIASVRGRTIPGRKLHILEVTLESGRDSGRDRSELYLTFFNQRFRERELLVGRVGLFAGKVTRFNNKLQLNSPEYVLDSNSLDSGPVGDGPREEGAFELGSLDAKDFANTLLPIYPAVASVRTWTVQRSVQTVLMSLDEVADPLPFEVLASSGLAGYDWALRHIHQPNTVEESKDARRRLAFDEAFGVQLVLAQRRREARSNPTRPRPRQARGLLTDFDARLPFTLTDEQVQIGHVVSDELAGEHPMQRLLQGEVGSGKTVVALRAMLQVVDSGGQAVLLAPTEVLAAQHAETIRELLGPLALGGQLGGADHGTRVALLTGSMATAARRSALLEAASGEAGIVIGTHALIEDHVQFADLGLVVVDEQHRFGVEQRDALRAKSAAPPHMLVMTATPIPRTVAITVYGDLEVSELKQLPAGRSEIGTTVVPINERPAWLERVWTLIHEEVAKGRQVYIVCPRIGDDVDSGLEPDAELAPPEDDDGDDGADGDDRPIASVLATAEELARGPLSDLRLGIMHGRLPAEQKAAVMADFVAGRVQVMIATTVIEVGVNVPNATVMVVLDSDRFGVSQLHQLRGRIGRGRYEDTNHRNHCLLLTRLPSAHPSVQRLLAVAGERDGFKLARLDLEQRREGDVLGASQSGRSSQLRLLSLLRDEALIADARSQARTIVEDDPELTAHPELARMLAAAFEEEQARFLQKS
ncbi:ATP-dependent DNA helicase RecG [Jatrophihabitans telluris]|uniref:Probable DNA 3'-5' helicase RecG n=1 Tax=Jatrophihabitans telluris TaxID=2038343 RepID=A0ABY4R2L2_9ACTN|nr:ATP-dependent DNA helicase RecG [Jatrophihabitans telluris]UQX89965.1 ATP-dependent DNA helicase RecG [Jatrophihabitans telluris]